ncbi:MAG: Lrp/AsnC family transcriptional regulator [Gemmatimonadales bacterium]|nr:Lrp/AsnC family transcriptional regulator [Gemmatimonadales bacterium]
MPTSSSSAPAQRAVALDPIDRALLAFLQDDGRASYQSLADQVGLSRPATMERVKRLEEAGFITGYAARIDRARLGRGVTAFVAVRVPEGPGPESDGLLAWLAAAPSVLECHTVAGDDCWVLKVAAPSLEALEALLRDIKAQGSRVTTRTTVVLTTQFEKAGVALPADAA